MTEEEKKAIDYYKDKEISFTVDYNTEELLNALGIEQTEEDSFENNQIRFKTILNLMQKQQEYIEEVNDITTDMSEDIKKLIAEIEIKDKIIDRMAIKIHTLDDGRTNYCDGKSNGDCEILHCKDCIKKYYREKVEE